MLGLWYQRVLKIGYKMLASIRCLSLVSENYNCAHLGHIEVLHTTFLPVNQSGWGGGGGGGGGLGGEGVMGVS